MKCPKCKDCELKTGNPKGYEVIVDTCLRCKGIFLENGEITQFIPNKKKIARMQAHGLENMNKVDVLCPKCNVNMFEGKAPGFGTTLDHCAKCNGYWLDHGELYEIIKNSTEDVTIATAPQSTQPLQPVSETHIVPPIEPPKWFGDVSDSNEEFYWSGGPLFIPFILSGLPFLIFGCLWGAFDLLFLTAATFGKAKVSAPGFTLSGFLLLHSAPFWLSIINMVRLFLVHGNTHYALTNKRIMLRTGFLGIDFRSIDYDQISDVEVTVGPIQKLFNCGSIKPFTGRDMMAHNMQNSRGIMIPTHGAFISIVEPYKVFRLLKELSVNVKTDWQYPNAMRPSTNPGYNTKYRKA